MRLLGQDLPFGTQAFEGICGVAELDEQGIPLYVLTLPGVTWNGWDPT